MKKPTCSPIRFVVLPVALLLASLGSAWAEKADRDKPMNVVADTLKYDDLKQISQFVGNVVMTKGTLVIRAERVDVRQDPQGYQYGTATGAVGKKATFRQKREKVDEWIEGEGETLTYNGRADTITFTQSAVIRRLRGASVSDESTGHLIVYDNTTDVFTVDGGKKSASNAPGAPTGRIRAVLTPQSAAREEVAPVGSGISLRPSSAVTGEVK